MEYESSSLASLFFLFFLCFFFSMQEHDVEQKCLEITLKHAFLGIFWGEIVVICSVV